MIYLINYDLHSPEQNYQRLISAIKSYNSWAKITQSCWAIRTQQTITQVHKHLVQNVDNNDRVFICPVTHFAAYNIPADVVNWFNSR